jgi:hypothetical protein
MKTIAFALSATLLLASTIHAQSSRTYVGVVTDTMCGRDHAMMKITPDSKCVLECVRSSKTVKFALLEGSNVYTLSDQETPAKFAAQKVKVTGVLNEKTKILKVEKIEAAN